MAGTTPKGYKPLAAFPLERLVPEGCSLHSPNDSWAYSTWVNGQSTFYPIV